MPINPSLQSMFTQTSNVTNNLAVSLLTHYSFDLGGYSASELVKRWENQYPSNWVHLAIIEALYQGRYKAVSVQQILNLWLRRNHPGYHFNMEFERLICNKLPENLKWNSLPPALPAVTNNPTIKDVIRNYQSSQTVNSDYQNSSSQRNIPTSHAKETSVEGNNYRTPESVGALSEENTNTRQISSSLPASSGMILSTTTKKFPAATTRSAASSTLTETKNHFVTDSEIVLEEQLETPIISKTKTKTITKLLPPARNHPPIEQFTPDKSDTSETFTSKLKAIVTQE